MRILNLYLNNNIKTKIFIRGQYIFQTNVKMYLFAQLNRRAQRKHTKSVDRTAKGFEHRVQLPALGL